MIIDSMLNELKAISTDWNNSEITLEERNIKLDLIIQQLQLLEIDFSNAPLNKLDDRTQATYNQLLFKSRYKGLSSLEVLKQTSTKMSYNARLRFILGSRIYLKPLEATLGNNINAYLYGGKPNQATPDIQVLVLKKVDDDGTEEK